MEILKPCKYCDLRPGDLFTLGNKKAHTYTAGGIRTVEDHSVYRKEREGSLQVIDVFGIDCEADGFKSYPYYDMPVMKIERD